MFDGVFILPQTFRQDYGRRRGLHIGREKRRFWKGFIPSKRSPREVGHVPGGIGAMVGRR